MRLNYILSALSIVLISFGIVTFSPIAVALYFHDFDSVLPFIVAGGVSVLSGLALRIVFKEKQNFNDLHRKEGLFIVALTWCCVALIAAIPYLFYNLSPINALFEGVSGITATGATILADFSLYPKTLFFWRGFTQWLGGMGVIILFIAVLPQFAVAGRQLFFAEVPGPTEEKIAPRIKFTAFALWGIYLTLTVIEAVMLKLTGMPLFDAICNSLSTIAAGGLSPSQNSIMGYGNNKFIWIITFFMFLSGVNFTLQYKLLVQRQLKSLLSNTEFWVYTGIFAVFSILVALALVLHNQYHIYDALRDSMFQVISILTSTGFASINFDEWTNSAKILLFSLMLIGGSAGSASGGIKVVRVIIIFKYLWREIVLILHPQSVIPVKLAKTTVPPDVLRQIIAFVIFYFLILIVTSILTATLERDLTVGIVGSAATLGNVGPGFGNIGPLNNFNDLRFFTKVIFIFNMLVGRLELIPFIAMLHGDFWKFKKQGDKICIR